MISEAADRSEEAASSSSLRAASHAAVASSIVDAADVISLFPVRHLRCGGEAHQAFKVGPPASCDRLLHLLSSPEMEGKRSISVCK